MYQENPPLPGINPEMEKDLYEAYGRNADKNKFPSAELKEVADELTGSLKIHFKDAVDRHLSEIKDKPEFVQHARETRCDELGVEIYDTADKIKSRLSDFEIQAVDDFVSTGEVLLVIKLPEAINSAYLQNESYIYKEEFLELYNFSITTIWEHIDAFDDAGARIERINKYGMHDNTPLAGYYYLWRLVPKHLPQHFDDGYLLNQDYEDNLVN